MNRFLVESPHEARDCKLAVKQVMSLGYLNHFDWGCESGVHKGWATIEAEDGNQALGVVPALLRDKARAIRVNKFASHVVERWKD